MHVFLRFAIFFYIIAYVASSVNIPEIFQKPKKKIEIPAPKSLDIREATSEEFNCVGRPNGNHANLKDCMSFYACVQNQTYFVVCPEFPAYQTYFNPVKRLCDQSDVSACLSYEIPLDEMPDEGIGNTENTDEGEGDTEAKDSAQGERDANNKNSGEDSSNESEESEEDHKKGKENSKRQSGEEIDSDEDETKSNRLDDEL